MTGKKPPNGGIVETRLLETAWLLRGPWARPVLRGASCGGRLSPEVEFLGEPGGLRCEALTHALTHLEAPDRERLFDAMLTSYLAGLRRVSRR